MGQWSHAHQKYENQAVYQLVYTRAWEDEFVGTLADILAVCGYVPPTEIKDFWKLRVRRKNYVIYFLNFQVNISINVNFHSGKRDETTTIWMQETIRPTGNRAISLIVPGWLASIWTGASQNDVKLG